MDIATALRQATAHHQANRLAEAQALYRQILGAAPGHPDALHLLGVLAHQTGHHGDGEKLIRQAIAQAPQATGFQTSLGHVLRAQGRAGEAEAAYRIALRAQPNAPENHHNLALALRAQGRAADAEGTFRHALRLRKDFVPARLDLGNLLIETGRPKEAEACLRAALRTAPAHPLVYNALGLALAGQGLQTAALAAFDDALRAAPGYQNAAVNRAHCLAALEQFEAAADAYAAAVRAAPVDMDLRHAYARTLLRLGRGVAAEAELRTLLLSRPDDTEALHNLARAHAMQDRPDLALPLLQQVCRAAPDNADAWCELGMAYRDLGRWPEAVAPHAEAVRLCPDDANMRSCYAYALLANGDFAAGWPEFQWRVRKPGNVRLREPEWDGTRTDKTVIIHAEQGVGDTLQFCRFIPQAATLARIVLACPPSLKTLLQTLPNVAEVADGKPVPAYDMHCALMSLPAVLDIAPERFAETVPYLSADPARVALWHDRFAALPRPRVGVVWAGNPVYPADRKRSVPFPVLAPLLSVPGVSFVSLQVGEAEAASQGFAFDAAPMLVDYADTAAALMALDLVISVDTSTAHLAGALDRPVWLLNRADTDWRWLLERSDTPWYPSMKIFRQRAPGDWPSAVSAIVSELTGVWRLGSQLGAGAEPQALS
jgi:tetratricopeptide (TPR) repeat protein